MQSLHNLIWCERTLRGYIATSCFGVTLPHSLRMRCVCGRDYFKIFLIQKPEKKKCNFKNTHLHMDKKASEASEDVERLPLYIPPTPAWVSRFPQASRGRSYGCPRILWSAVKSQGSEINLTLFRLVLIHLWSHTWRNQFLTTGGFLSPQNTHTHKT